MTFLSFPPSSVMIRLAFLTCFLVFFLFIKDQRDPFHLKQIVVFLKCSVCVFYISLRLSLITELQQIRSEYCMQLKVWTSNMNYDQKE